MRILVASDSFKGSLSSIDVCKAVSEGIKEVIPNCEVVMLPIADGGEGTLEAMSYATGGRLVEAICTNPVGERISGHYSISGDGKTAVIEMAKAAGLYLINREQRNPYYTTTFGVGELIIHALDKGCRNFIVGIGGSATNDGGVGMLQALGFSFLDKARNEIDTGGLALGKIDSIDPSNRDKRLDECTFKIACDVDNTLCGPKGASYIFGPQKGATPQMVKELDSTLKHYANVIHRDLGVKVLDIKGGGAAGGLGTAFVGFLNAELVSGVDLILDSLKFSEKLEGIDLVITGEGQIDDQTAHGKVPMGVAKRAKEQNIPVVAIVGSISGNVASLYQLGLNAIFSVVNKPMTLDQAMNNAYELVQQTAKNVVGLFNT
ncbi:glycerate kinase [Alkalicella caledoniensis]|uniref:Glycerate kinase n=1 Tax=Alkalicella caledoniensis TaxID=2731377 RepID=A0A7G9W7E5_ALKCA|nr:glycerate kinase [Alkalicella caledoniensis]QNO14607.1 glycerate kinase [Alkalicella caledoniensis]